MTRPIPTTRFDLIPPGAERRLAELYAKDANKYGHREWERGTIPLSAFVNIARDAMNRLHAGDATEDWAAIACWAIFGYMHVEASVRAGRLPATLADMPAADPMFGLPEMPALPAAPPVPPAPPMLGGRTS